MPVSRTEQASILLSRQQAIALCGIVKLLPSTTVAITIEETNIDKTLAVTTQRGTTLIYHSGKTFSMDAGAVRS